MDIYKIYVRFNAGGIPYNFSYNVNFDNFAMTECKEHRHSNTKSE